MFEYVDTGFEKICHIESMKQLSISSIIIAKNTPAITIVELCNRADMGVGADIAFNNHVENGNWADLEYKI